MRWRNVTPLDTEWFDDFTIDWRMLARCFESSYVGEPGSETIGRSYLFRLWILAIRRHIDIPIAYQPLQHHHNTTRGSQTANGKPEQNQPINIILNQPIYKPEIQPIRRPLCPRKRMTQKHTTPNVPALPDEDSKN